MEALEGGVNSEQIGRYELLEQIDTGSTGRVYRVRDPMAPTELTGKRIHPEFSIVTEYRSALLRDAEAALSYQGAGVVALLGVEMPEDGRILLVTQPPSGHPLSLVFEHVQLSFRSVAWIGHRIAEILHHALQDDLVHGTLSPNNVYIDQRGEVSIRGLGLGASRLCLPPSPSSTPYRAPEFVSHRKTPRLDPRADIYSLGMLLTKASQHLSSHALRDILMRMTSRAPFGRPVEPQEVSTHIEGLVALDSAKKRLVDEMQILYPEAFPVLSHDPARPIGTRKEPSGGFFEGQSIDDLVDRIFAEQQPIPLSPEHLTPLAPSEGRDSEISSPESASALTTDIQVIRTDGKPAAFDDEESDDFVINRTSVESMLLGDGSRNLPPPPEDAPSFLNGPPPPSAPPARSQPPVPPEEDESEAIEVSLNSGDVIGGRYKVLGQLGEGGVAVVYKVEHVLMGEQMALKLLRPELALMDTLKERLRLEAKSCFQLNHPNIIRTYDLGLDPAPYLVMEYVEGQPLADVLDNEGSLQSDLALHIVTQILDGLSHAHAHQIIHRDLKPENIMIVEENRRMTPKILDFGLAKFGRSISKSAMPITQAGTVFGTPRYMSPEQALGEDIDLRTDVYAVGVLLYLALTGRHPFDGSTPKEILCSVVADDPNPMGLESQIPNGAQIESIVLKAIEKEKTDRFSSAAAFKRALRDCFNPPS